MQVQLLPGATADLSRAVFKHMNWFLTVYIVLALVNCVCTLVRSDRAVDAESFSLKRPSTQYFYLATVKRLSSENADIGPCLFLCHCGSHSGSRAT